MLDKLIATSALILCAPAMAVIAFAIFVHDGRPILFSQTRIGRGGKSFQCLKFRTMVTDSQARLEHLLSTNEEAAIEWSRDQKLKNDPRITWIGRFLRKTSLDELPQLINVLRGEMSIVGPRPIVQDEIERYGLNFESYASVSPGITGLWQVSGRNQVAYEDRVLIDVRYANNWSIRGDIVIMFKTIPAVLLGTGAN